MPALVEFGVPATLALAALVLAVGRAVLSAVPLLQRHSIPAAVVGGLIAAAIAGALHVAGTDLAFARGLQPGMMLAFFATVGLGADLRMLARGGSRLARFALAVLLMLVAQNAVGVLAARLLGLDPAIGLLAGSITMAGGHGTGAAWGAKFAESFGIQAAPAIAIAAATFGLVAGGLVGGPVARRLIERLAAQGRPLGASAAVSHPRDGAHGGGPMTADRLTLTLLLVAACMVAGEWLGARMAADAPVTLPPFVWTLLCGVVLRNLLAAARVHEVDDRALDLAGQVSLGLFLAIALMGLRLWEVAALAGPVLVIVALQVLVVAALATFVTFRLVGGDYEAAVLVGGQCGFGLGATPTAMANMQALTERFGHAPSAFVVVPIMGAFLIDLMNALVIGAFAAGLPALR
ncbi:MAG: sodium/glutamate symporter [Burkholderiales bacterium]|jgi:ESS family glutamate:Na+ symporter